MSRGKWIIAFLCVPAALLGAALLNNQTMIHKNDSVGNVTSKVHFMRHHDHCHAFLSELTHYL